MDPVANLREQRGLSSRMLGRPDENGYYDVHDMSEDGYRLAELVLALDEWMRKGGFSPWS